MAEIDTEKFDGNRDSKKLESTSIEKSLSGNEPSGAISAEDLKKAKWAWFKCDINIVGWAWVLYLVSVIDRINVGNARVMGMQKDLHLSNNEYNWALSIFFFGYVLCETPANMMMRALTPRKWLSFLTVILGIVTVMTYFVKNAAGLFALRFFLGVIEAGLPPGLSFWISCWYPRHMQGRRYAMYYSAIPVTGAFGGLIATAINEMKNKRGIAGWRWIFIIEGCVTFTMGIISWFMLSDYPDTAWFLTKEEQQLVCTALRADRAQLPNEPKNWPMFWTGVKDPRTYLWFLMFLSTVLPVYSILLSLPSVVIGLGYAGKQAVLMACPPYAVGFVLVIISGYTSDRYRERFFHLVFGCVMSMIALITLMTVENLHVRYGMYFLQMCMFIPVNMIWAWSANNIAGSNKRAASQAIMYCGANVGGAISGQIYRAEWGPRYVKSHGIICACYAVAMAAGTTLYLTYRNENRRRDREGPVRKPGDMLGTDLGILGDRHPDFRYFL